MLFRSRRARKLRNQIDIEIVFPINTTLAELTAIEHEGQIVTFEAVVSDWGAKDSIIYNAIYKCGNCGATISQKYHGTKTISNKCQRCDENFEYFVPSNSEDMRRIRLREIVTEYTRNKQPAKIVADAYGRTAHNLELSNKVVVTGIFTSIPLGKEHGRMNQRFMPTIQIISMQKKSEVIEMPDMDLIKKIKDLESEGKLIDAVIDAFAFNIFGKRMEKKATICTILGSEWIGGNNPPQIYLLFVGDPDTFKSTIMKYVPKVLDNSIVADATAVSGNGIKAVAVKMDDGTWSIRAGLLPSYHGGVVCFDEFGDLKEDIYAELKNVMVDGRVRKHVAGEDFDAVAETGIVATMNPIYDVWDDSKELLDNLEVLGKALITRFDAIFRFPISFCNEHEDEIDSLLTISDIHGKPKALLTDHELKLFFNYIREKIHPKITMEALEQRNQFFKSIRTKNKDNSNFETRTKNSVMKFATALAKWHLSDKVLPVHVDEALSLYKASLETLNRKLEDGEYLNETNLKHTVDGRTKAIEESIENLIDENGFAFKDEVKALAMSKGVFDSQKQYDSIYAQLLVTGKIGRAHV